VVTAPTRARHSIGEPVFPWRDSNPATSHFCGEVSASMGAGRKNTPTDARPPMSMGFVEWGPLQDSPRADWDLHGELKFDFGTVRAAGLQTTSSPSPGSVTFFNRVSALASEGWRTTYSTQRRHQAWVGPDFSFHQGTTWKKWKMVSFTSSISLKAPRWLEHQRRLLTDFLETALMP
jgi:hypothetical protein